MGDVILIVRDDGFVQVVIDTARLRTLSPEADRFFEPLPAFVALMQDSDGKFAFADADEVEESGAEPALLSHPDETTRFLNWIVRTWNARRPIRAVLIDEDRADARSRRRYRLRTPPQRYTRRGRRDL